MREEEFRIWASDSLKPASVDSYTYHIQKVENAENINIDEEFDKDHLNALIARYENTVAEAQAKGVEPPKLNVGTNSLGDYRSIIRKYKAFRLAIGDAPAYEARDNASDTNTSATFGLEKDLQAALRKHIDQLESGLKIVDGGSERSVDSGRIDILAKDSNGTFVIIELKAGTATDSVVAQILGYMGDIAEEENAEVRGIIVAADFNKRVQSASRATSNLELKTYRYNFEFN